MSNLYERMLAETDLSKRKLTEEQAEQYCRRMWPEEWGFHMQMLRLDGDVIEEYDDAWIGPF